MNKITNIIRDMTGQNRLTEKQVDRVNKLDIRFSTTKKDYLNSPAKQFNEKKFTPIQQKPKNLIDKDNREIFYNIIDHYPNSIGVMEKVNKKKPIEVYVTGKGVARHKGYYTDGLYAWDNKGTLAMLNVMNRPVISGNTLFHEFRHAQQNRGMAPIHIHSTHGKFDVMREKVSDKEYDKWKKQPEEKDAEKYAQKQLVLGAKQAVPPHKDEIIQEKDRVRYVINMEDGRQLDLRRPQKIERDKKGKNALYQPAPDMYGDRKRGQYVSPVTGSRIMISQGRGISEKHFPSVEDISYFYDNAPEEYSPTTIHLTPKSRGWWNEGQSTAATYKEAGDIVTLFPRKKPVSYKENQRLLIHETGHKIEDEYGLVYPYERSGLTPETSPSTYAKSYLKRPGISKDIRYKKAVEEDIAEGFGIWHKDIGSSHRQNITNEKKRLRWNIQYAPPATIDSLPITEKDSGHAFTLHDAKIGDLPIDTTQQQTIQTERKQRREKFEQSMKNRMKFFDNTLGTDFKYGWTPRQEYEMNEDPEAFVDDAVDEEFRGFTTKKTDTEYQQDYTKIREKGLIGKPYKLKENGISTPTDVEPYIDIDSNNMALYSVKANGEPYLHPEGKIIDKRRGIVLREGTGHGMYTEDKDRMPLISELRFRTEPEERKAIFGTLPKKRIALSGVSTEEEFNTEILSKKKRYEPWKKAILYAQDKEQLPDDTGIYTWQQHSYNFHPMMKIADIKTDNTSGNMAIRFGNKPRLFTPAEWEAHKERLNTVTEKHGGEGFILNNPGSRYNQLTKMNTILSEDKHVKRLDRVQPLFRDDEWHQKYNEEAKEALKGQGYTDDDAETYLGLRSKAIEDFGNELLKDPKIQKILGGKE